MAVAEGGPCLEGPTGATAMEMGECTKLDTTAELRLTRAMKSTRRKSSDSELAELAKRREQKRGELEEMAERIGVRAQMGKPATARMLARIEEMRAEYLAIQQRYERRHASTPARPSGADEF